MASASHGGEIHEPSHEPHYCEQLSGIYCTHGSTQPPPQPSFRTSHPERGPDHYVVPPCAPTPAPGNHQSASCPAGLSVLGRGHSREGVGVSEGPDRPAYAVPTESPSQISASLGCLCCFFSLSLSSLQDKIKGRSLKQNTTFFFPDRFYTEGLSKEPPSGTSL